MNCPKTVLQSYDMENTLGHAENKTMKLRKALMKMKQQRNANEGVKTDTKE